MSNTWLKYLLALVPILLFAGISIYLYLHFSQDYLVNLIGIDNAYLLVFVMAVIGGFTTFNVVPYHLVLINFAVSGLNPWALGFLAAVGVSLGDSTSYYLGYYGRVILPVRTSAWFDRIHTLAKGRPRLFMLLCLLYSSFVPESNDLLTIPAGLARIPFLNVMLPLVVGNIIFDVSLAFLAPQALEVIEKVFL